MKFKTTKKAIKDGYSKILSIGYCGAQSLLRYTEPVAYSTRIEGWACDYYDIDGVCISTGYNTIGQQVDRYKLSAYEHTASEINASAMSYEDKKREVNALLSQFIQEVTGT